MLIEREKKKLDVAIEKASKATSTELNSNWLSDKSHEISQQSKEPTEKMKSSKKKSNKRSRSKNKDDELSPKKAKSSKDDMSLWWDNGEMSQQSSSLNKSMDTFGNKISVSQQDLCGDKSSITAFLNNEVFGDENFNIENHVCFKDEKISKVRQIIIINLCSQNSIFNHFKLHVLLNVPIGQKISQHYY